MWPDIQEQVAIERANIEQLFAAYAVVIHKAAHEEPNFIEQSALSTMLHSFYNGIENIFKRIALGIDGEMPSGSASHSALLSLMLKLTTIARLFFPKNAGQFECLSQFSACFSPYVFIPTGLE